MSKRDYYQVLDIQRNASEAEIKKAFKRMAMKHHPDRNPDNSEAEQTFKEAKEAYDILSDPQKRAAYDQFGHAGVDPSSAGGGFSGGFGGGNFSDVFGDVFGDIFGGSNQRVHRGSDLRYNLELPLAEAVNGTDVQIRIPTQVSCTTCGGSGAEPGSSPVTCGTCNGQGQVRIQQGYFSIQQTCPKCHGRGSVITKTCKVCHGHGRIEKQKTLSVKVPAGVDNGDRIRLSGEGAAGENGGPAGDLFVQIYVSEHPIFQRDGSDLLCEVPISFVVASLGGEIDVPTLDGRVKLRVPPETQSGRLLRLRGKGVKAIRSGAQGDLLCRVAIETPVNLSEKQKSILREFDESMQKGAHKHSPKHSSWLDGVKKFFEDMKL